MADAIQLIYPVGQGWPVSQDFDGHVATARRNGWCIRPGTGCLGYYYPGIDWACADETPGQIAALGIVVKAGLDPTTKANKKRGYGNRLQVLHDNGWTTVYAHLANWFVTVGERVGPGRTAYLTDNTGYSTGSHIHWELRDENGIPIDPMPYLVGAATPIPTPVPVPVPVEYPGAAIFPLSGAQYRVIKGYEMNKRAGPGTSYEVIGSIVSGEVVVPKRLIVYNGWMELETGYCAMVYQGVVYLMRAT